MSLRRVRDILPLVEETNVGPDTIGVLRDEIHRLALAMNSSPTPAVLPDLLAAQNLLFRLLEGRQQPQQSRDLNFLTAAASSLVSGACFLIGNAEASKTHGRLAYICATNAGHQPFQAWVRGLQALHAYWEKQTGDALRYCLLARETPMGSGSLSAWVPAVEARIRASMGNGPAARASIDRARAARDRVEPDDLDELGGDFAFPLTSQLFNIADALSLISGDAREAERAALDAIAGYDSAQPDELNVENQTLARVCLARARVRLSEIDGAEAALEPVLDLPSEFLSEPLRFALENLHGLLTTSELHDSAKARELTSRAEQMLRTPRILAI